MLNIKRSRGNLMLCWNTGSSLEAVVKTSIHSYLAVINAS
jgi:hypothetical protein